LRQIYRRNVLAGVVEGLLCAARCRPDPRQRVSPGHL